MEIVASARVICRSRPVVAAIPPIVDLVASFLAPPDSWTVEVAIQRGCTHLVRHLLDELEADPEIHHLIKRSRARKYLSEAAAVGDIALLEYLVARFGCCVDGWAIAQAVKGSQLEALQWLYECALASLAPGQDIDTFKESAFPDRILVLAGVIGHLEMLQWMQRILGSVSAYRVLRGATRRGHLHVVEWVFPLVETPMINSDSFYLTQAVICGGHLDVTKFLHSKGVLTLTSDTMDGVVLYDGQLELLQWMYDNSGEGCTNRAIDDAARNGRLDVVQWLLSKGLNYSPRAMNEAARNGHLEVVKFLHENRSEGCSSDAFQSAVWNNHLDVVRYVFEHRRGDFAVVSIDEVASNGGLGLLKWLQINCPDAECTVIAMDSAAANNHLDVVRFLHNNRTEGCTTNAMDRAARNGNLDVVEWLHFNRTEGCTAKAIDDAARIGHLEVVKFLHSHRTEGCTTDAMDSAFNSKVLRWLGENRREGFTANALSNAAMQGDIEMLVWLRGQTPAELWRPELATYLMKNGWVEALEWFADTFPALVDARMLLSNSQQKWWVWTWLRQRVDP